MKVQNKGGKGNPNHDEEGKFTSADDAGSKVEESEVNIDVNAGNEKIADDDVGAFVLAFDPFSADDILASMEEGGLTKGEKILKSREMLAENSKYLEYTNYSELDISIEEKKSLLDISSQEYDKEKIADLSKTEIEALYQSECVLNAKRQNEQKIIQLEEEKKKVLEAQKDAQLKYLIQLQNEGHPVALYDVWANAVSLDDYEAKAKIDETGTSAIDRKRQYYEDIINDELGFDDEIAAAQQKLNNLNAWVEAGEKYLANKAEVAANYIDALEGIETKLGSLKKQQDFFNSDEFKAVLEDNRKFAEIYQDKNAPYSKARKDAALWFKTDDEDYAVEKARKYFMPRMEAKLKELTGKEKNIVKAYTGSGYSRFNKPLRGIMHDAYGYSFNNSTGTFSKAVMDMTNAIDKCTWDDDIWVQRGINNVPIFVLPGSSKPTTLTNMTDEQLQSLVGTSFTDGGFYSAGAGKGTGFSSSEIIINTYCPKGTKMIYAEAVSAYKGENEMILQRGYTYKITKVEKKGYRYFIDAEVVLGSDENKAMGNKLKEIGNKYYYGPRGLPGEMYD